MVISPVAMGGNRMSGEVSFQTVVGTGFYRKYHLSSNLSIGEYCHMVGERASKSLMNDQGKGHPNGLVEAGYFLRNGVEPPSDWGLDAGRHIPAVYRAIVKQLITQSHVVLPIGKPEIDVEGKKKDILVFRWPLDPQYPQDKEILDAIANGSGTICALLGKL